VTSDQWGPLIQQFGFPIAALFAVIYVFMSGKVVTRREFDQEVSRGDAERDERLRLQDQVTRLLEAQASTVERLSGHGRRGDISQ
jgi:hypothetical protein